MNQPIIEEGTIQKQDFTKECVLPKNLIPLLKERGLIIEDENKTIDYLTTIGYFRLSAYLRPLYKDSKSRVHEFKDGATFSLALNMYRFDRKLRLLVFNEMEKIEVAIRGALSNTVSNRLNDVFWFTNETHYQTNERIKKNGEKRFEFLKTKQIIEDSINSSKEEFIKHFKEYYTNDYPPAWMVAETLPFGTLCKIYQNIKYPKIQKDIAKHFGLNKDVFISWIEILSSLRNMCCHHARLWNRVIPIVPQLPKKMENPWISNGENLNPKRMYLRLCIIKYMLDRVSPSNSFTKKLKDVISQYNTIDVRAMGFPKNWDSEPLWQTPK